MRNYSNQSTNGRSSRMKREFKLAQTLALVVICFFLCWTPLMILHVIDYGSSKDFFIKPTIAQAIMVGGSLQSNLLKLNHEHRFCISILEFAYIWSKIPTSSSCVLPEQKHEKYSLACAYNRACNGKSILWLS